MPTFVQVALPVPVFKLFTYGLPEPLAARASVGSRVSVPFGRRTMTGIVMGHSETTDLEKVRDVLDTLDESPPLSEALLKLAEWMSEYYVSPVGETLRSMLPQGTAPESSQRISLAHSDAAAELPSLRRTAPRQAAIVAALSDHPNGVSLAFLRKSIGAENLYAQLIALEERGLIMRSSETSGAKPKTVRGVRLVPALLDDESRMHALLDDLDRTAPRQAAVLSLLYSQSERNGNTFIHASELLKGAKASDGALKSLSERGAIEIEQIEVSREEVLASIEDLDETASTMDHVPHEIVLNMDQTLAVDSITGSMESREFRTFLLHGVTGSGKTQVYIEAIRFAVARGQTAMMLVPEIALTLQLVERFVSVFGDGVAVLHSRLSEGERYDTWRRVAAGDCTVVIGARSALFAPLRNIGIIVVDEEHEGSYKQYDAQPRYNARDAAIVRASIEGAVAVLGSATPSVESYYNAQRGKYHLLELPVRVDNAKEPKMVIVDTLTARNQRLMRGSLSMRLLNDIKERLAKKEGVILFQNRRGFATRLECASCSHSPMCPHCAVTLTYHKSRDELRCHYCGYVRKAERVCAVCGHADLRQPGVGTQKVEEELAEQLPDARITRMDLDTTSRKGAHRKILALFAKGEVDILLGTQMVAKGLDFSRVTLVGVISADTQLLLPDFRASERTFQLLTQVSGRAGRRSGLEGEVVIQTSHPNHPAIQAAFAKNFLMMYNDELLARRELNYPPFARFIVIEFRSEDQKETEKHARLFRSLLPADSPAFQTLGPTMALIWKLRNLFRYQIVIKNSRAIDPGGKIFAAAFSKAYETYRTEHAKASVQLIVDVDAQGM